LRLLRLRCFTVTVTVYVCFGCYTFYGCCWLVYPHFAHLRLLLLYTLLLLHGCLRLLVVVAFTLFVVVVGCCCCCCCCYCYVVTVVAVVTFTPVVVVVVVILLLLRCLLLPYVVVVTLLLLFGYDLRCCCLVDYTTFGRLLLPGCFTLLFCVIWLLRHGCVWLLLRYTLLLLLYAVAVGCWLRVVTVGLLRLRFILRCVYVRLRLPRLLFTLLLVTVVVVRCFTFVVDVVVLLRCCYVARC